MPWYFMLYSFKSKESFFPLEKRLMNNVLQNGEETFRQHSKVQQIKFTPLLSNYLTQRIFNQSK